MPAEWSFWLEVPEPMRVHRNDIHSVLSRWLDRSTDTSMVAMSTPPTSADHHANNKAWHLRGATQVGSSVIEVRVALLDDTDPSSPGPGMTDAVPAVDQRTSKPGLVDSLLVGIRRSLDLAAERLGNQPFRTLCRSNSVGVFPIREGRAMTWGDLLSVSPRQRATLILIEPATSHSGNDYLPILDPRRIIESLERRWRGCDGAAPDLGPVSFLAPTARQRVALLTHGANVKTTVEKVSFGGRPKAVVGTTGSMELGLRVTDVVERREWEQLFATLLAFAPFAGIGAETTRGFGVTAIGTSSPDDHGWKLARPTASTDTGTRRRPR